MRTRVKICGITRAEDARVAVGLGADALGFVFWKRSRRYIQPERAGELVRQLPAMVCAVAVVVDPASDELEEIVAKSGVDLVQFHGDESRDFCERAPVPYIKAVRVRAAGDVERLAVEHPNARALLLDTYRHSLPGGTGESFDWNLVPRGITQALILAGGLSGSNVVSAITAVSPFAVDVSGGVEAKPGIKDPDLMRELFREVNRATAFE